MFFFQATTVLTALSTEPNTDAQLVPTTLSKVAPALLIALIVRQGNTALDSPTLHPLATVVQGGIALVAPRYHKMLHTVESVWRVIIVLKVIYWNMTSLFLLYLHYYFPYVLLTLFLLSICFFFFCFCSLCNVAISISLKCHIYLSLAFFLFSLCFFPFSCSFFLILMMVIYSDKNNGLRFFP